MAITNVEIPRTEDLRLSLTGTGETRIKRFRTRLTGDDVGKTSADIVGVEPDSGPTIPALGTAHPEAPDLIVQTVDGEHVDDSHRVLEFTCVYSYPTGGYMEWPAAEYHRKRFRIIAENVRIYADVTNGSQIGETHYVAIVDGNGDPIGVDGDDPAWIDPDAELGAYGPATKTQFDIELAGLHDFNPAWYSLAGFVNSGPFLPTSLNVAEGLVQYLGCELDEQLDPVTQARNLYSGILHFAIGKLVLYVPDVGTRTFYMDERPHIERKKVVHGTAPNQWTESVIVNVEARKIAVRADLNLLIPNEPGKLGPPRGSRLGKGTP